MKLAVCALAATALFDVLPTTEAIVLRQQQKSDKVASWFKQETNSNCLDWDKLNRTVEMTERASANLWSSDTLVREVAAQYCHEQSDTSPECLQQNAGISIENRPVTSLTDVKDFSAKWDAAIRDAPECAKYKGFEWEVDVFVQQPGSDRSATLHRHPMPLVTLTLPIQREKADEIQVPKVMCLSNENGSRVELSAQLGRFFPLAAGLAHREQIDETNRIFMVLIPKTRNLLSFRLLKKSDKQGRDRTKSQWTRLDSLNGIINMWYPMEDDPEKDGANRFLEYMKKP